jgi:lantibiotic modifying enzyme
VNYREAALGASEWLLAQAVATEHGIGWPEEPGGDVENDLYGGTPGALLTMLDAYAATRDDRFAVAAARAGDHLIAAARDEEYSGLYVGLAGIGFALDQLANALDEPSHRTAVSAIVNLIRAKNQREYTDIIIGVAGTLCWLESAGGEGLSADLAGWLVSVGERRTLGTTWRMDFDDPRYLPNFSHGTAGVAYALATAGFVDEAIHGADYLVSVAERPDNGFRVFHFEPGGEHLFPFGWCHGPTGTARLFQVLADKTGDESWTELRDACAHTVRTSGIPERKEPGFWDNVAACCGSTGVAKFFLDLHRRTGDAEHLRFARAMADDTVEHATVDDSGVRWSNIEHRLPEPTLPPGLGAMQGAAGIASFLFELDRFLAGDASYRRWPDNPF